MDVDSRPHLVEIVAALKEITARISTASTIAEAIDDLAKVTADIVPRHVRCGVTLISEGEPATFAATGLPLDVLDEANHAGGDGPCMEAVRTREIAISQDLAAESRWPAWSGLARRHGLSGVLSYPFDVDPLVIGALNLYAERPNEFASDLPMIAMLVADHANLLLRVRMRQLNHELQVGFDQPAEAVVERAIGIVMAQRGCAPEHALRQLHDAATHLGVGLPAVAERLVRTVSNRGGGAAPSGEPAP